MFWFFRDRSDAGRQLAQRLGAYASRRDVLVLALPRGGVPIGHEVARALGAPLDVLVVRKLGVPDHPELAMGAIASGGGRYLNEELREFGISDATVQEAEARERAEIRRREDIYREGLDALDVRGRIVIVVDDGIATGATLRAAIAALRSLQPARIVAAVPVASWEAAGKVAGLADELVWLRRPVEFRGVGQFYRDFKPATDAEVCELLKRNREVPA